MAGENPFGYLKEPLEINGTAHTFYNLPALGAKYNKLPFSIRVLLESAVRNCDNFQIQKADVEKILNWAETQAAGVSVEVPFRPSRVVLQDFTGVPAVVDFAAMRDAVKALGGNPEDINPQCPSDLVIDHSVQVDVSRTSDAQAQNEAMEFQRNHERFLFLKWGAQAFQNMLIVPPGSGIVHQVNLEYLARVCFNKDGLLYPDSVVGTDSHTTMINGLGVVGWGVGGIEAEAVMLGQPISMVLPQVVGYKITGSPGPHVTSTDVVLSITKHLRQVGVVGKFVEFFGPGVTNLSIADRATIANMCPEYGATVGFFPVDSRSIDYLRQTSRDEKVITYVQKYMETVGMLRDFSSSEQDPIFSSVHELDLSTVVPSLSGPKRPHDRVSASDMKTDFRACLSNPVGFKGYALPGDKMDTTMPFTFDNKEYILKHGSVLIAAITSCTNTSNPSVMLGAGMLAKKAVEAGLTVAPYIKTSLSPGSGVVTYYLTESGVIPYLETLGFGVVGYGCMTCIGNSGPLPEPVVEAVEKGELVCCGVLSGNRNFEGRIHPHTQANYLASPLFVIAYAIAGRVDIDFETEPLATLDNGKEVFLRDIWPTREEIQVVETKYVIPAMFQEVYAKITTGNPNWNKLSAPSSILYPWDTSSTYIKHPPFFAGMTADLPTKRPIRSAQVLLNLGDSVTTDHISPAGSIPRNSPAARYLASRGLSPRDFNSFGSRRGNDAVMARGTFGNIRLVNKFIGKATPKTIHIPSGTTLDVFDAAQEYSTTDTDLIILAGKDYGCGSSRDWAAKGPFLLGIKAVIAESYERIHRSNLVGMGIVPLQYEEGQTAEGLGLTGKEKFDIDIPDTLTPGMKITVSTDSGKQFSVVSRFDTDLELTYYKHGGILNYMVRKLAAKQ
eukprot:TRINITY_DN1914_c0_g1_i1.p1 TRINITY_DN1914_c0_g1~~TRINITY_DN1914_c0_g1_i1.p1  ORF type:complete len:911 (-),score=302.67 TRINITY_DN1914_c0_g1_i1:168-2852(-)